MYRSKLARSIRATLLAVALMLATLPLFSSTSLAQDATPAGGTIASPIASPSTGSPLDRAVAWLHSQQAPDGGFVGFSGASDAGATADAVIALAAARNAGATIVLDAALAFLGTNGLVYTQTGPGQAAKLVLAVIAAGGNPRDVGGVDPLAIVETASQSSGLIGSGVFDHALAMLALAAAGSDVPDSAIDALRASQNVDGSWAFDGTVADGSGDSNTTAIAIQALAAAGRAKDIMIVTGLRYLRTTQTEDGGFTYQPADPSVADANSTGIVVQALIAAGEDPSSSVWRNASAALAAFQNASGAFRYQDAPPDDNLFATLQAIPALAGQPFPIAANSSSTPGCVPGTPAAGTATPISGALPCAA